MQTANVFVALGGRRANSVPKYGVTAAETAVLRLIHGEDAVYEIDVQGSVSRTHRQEIARLAQIYGRQEGERRISPAVNELFPGAAARVFETFDELEIPEELFAVKERKTAGRDPLDHDNDGRKGGSLTDAARVDKGLDGMTLKELQAHASRYPDLDLTGITRKADVLEALKLHEANLAATQDEDSDGDTGGDDGSDNDGTGDLNDEFTEQPSSVFG